MDTKLQLINEIMTSLTDVDESVAEHIQNILVIKLESYDITKKPLN